MSKLKLYRISQKVNNGYDTYDAAIVAAGDEDAARLTHPNGVRLIGKPVDEPDAAWAPIKDVRVVLIGSAAAGARPGVVLASFNAG
jgi:sensor histidine kinase regulating citrate/malate metabolism